MKTPLISIALAALLAGCAGQQPVRTQSGLDPERFVSGEGPEATALYTLSNAAGMEVCITNYGGRIVSVMVPDRDGVFRDVVLGFDSVQDYFPENNATDFGAAIGRYANRIGQGLLTIDGETRQLPQNNFGHCLHGGPTGWQYKVYQVLEADSQHLLLAITSPDGDNNFPGTVEARVRYTLTEDNKIQIDYEAVTDKPTVVNMTNHAYFNLSGNPADHKVTDDILYLCASHFTPVDSTFMTTGEILPVEGTPLDFTRPRRIGDGIDADHPQIHNARGYDHNWVLDTAGDVTVPAAALWCPDTGIRLQVFTTEPGIQVYAGNFLDGTVVGKGGTAYPQRSAICLETQHYPDSPNKPDWPSVVLRPGETYHSCCIYAFNVLKEDISTDN